MDEQLERELRKLIDRQAIQDCLLNYTRGADRLDVDLLKSAFHPDGIDNHTLAVRGTIETMLDWWLPQQPDREHTQHYLTNQKIDLDGDVAHAESYFFAITKLHGADRATVSGGRYSDRLERRDGVWAIAMRVVLPEWHAEVDTPMMTQINKMVLRGSRDRDDPTYQRPLQDPPH